MDDAMDSLWRGLKGAMVGAGIAGIIVVAWPAPWIGLALAALAGFLVGGISGHAARLPRKGVRILKNFAIVAGCAMLAIPIVAAAIRNWGMELPDLPHVPYMPSILAGLVGGVIVLAHEAGAAARSKANVDSGNHTSVTIRDNRNLKIDRFWSRVSFVAWLLAAGLLLVPWWRREGGGLDVFFTMAFACLLWGEVVMLYFVGIPLRIALNLIFKERRRQRLWETVMCVVAFLIMSVVAYMVIWVYPPSSMGY
jgi:hypothetical protein